MPGSALAEIEFRPALLSADTSAPAQKCAIRMAVRNQRANCPATSQYIVAAMFIMRTMVDERRNQINMPRLDAYSESIERHTTLLPCAGHRARGAACVYRRLHIQPWCGTAADIDASAAS